MNDILTIIDFESGTRSEEKVAGRTEMEWLYGSAVGESLRSVLKLPFASQLYGAWQSSSLSRSKIEPFVREFEIPMHEFESGPFDSFNDFFIRKFRTGLRSFPTQPAAFPAFAEGRYSLLEDVRANTSLSVKGATIELSELIQDSDLIKMFSGGSVLIARLCPVDYHRFHFPDDGHIERCFNISGELESVNPLTFQANPRVFLRNERHISVCATKQFGKILLLEVGAMMVGKIIQTHKGPAPFLKGDEKGYFLFGGSTCIAITQPGAVQWDTRLSSNTKAGFETLVRLGTCIGMRPHDGAN